MRAAVLAAGSAGVGLVTYTGHANHWNMGNMEPSPDPKTILSLYDVDQYANNKNEKYQIPCCSRLYSK